MTPVLLSIATALWMGARDQASDTVPALQVWTVDPLTKVFRDAVPEKGAPALAEVARGEHATFQIVVRCQQRLRNLRAEVARLALEEDTTCTLPPPRIRFVGYVPVDRPIQTAPKDQLRQPPADFPDPLLENEAIDVLAGKAQPVWITLAIPTDARPGLYAGEVTVHAETREGDLSEGYPLQARVFPAKVERSRLWVTNWFYMQSRHMSIQPKPGTEEYWDLLRRYARNMAEHRQNVAKISPFWLAEYQTGEDGQIDIDFSTFDRWVEIFIEEGVIGRIEGGHIGAREAGWNSQFIVWIREMKDCKIASARVSPASEEADRFYGRFFPALVTHLKEKGWLDIYSQHLADEPIPGNIETYRAAAKLVRKYAPELPIIEACHTKDLIGAIDIWVPQLNYYHQDYEHYCERQREGEEVWFYTCVFPQGEYANRFIEQPLLKTRLLHWINFTSGATGYLHWGYNHWVEDSPFTHTTRPHGGPPYLPAGDAWIVYPGIDGPLDSIRHEAMRDGIADHELLSQLAERNPEMAKELARVHVLDFDRYDCSVETFRKTRRQILETLSE